MYRQNTYKEESRVQREGKSDTIRGGVLKEPGRTYAQLNAILILKIYCLHGSIQTGVLFHFGRPCGDFVSLTLAQILNSQ